MSEEKGRDRDAAGASAPRGAGEDARGATLRVIERHGAQVMRTARRYAATLEDAEDAYQRAVEIMLVKAPDVPDAELLPWLKTVVRHEAFALRRKDERAALGTVTSFDGDVGGDDEIVSSAPTPGEQVERFERLRLGAEALSALKPQEARALALLAQGYSYSQISEETGWTYTKVNRCLAEGRQSFVSRVAGIESGAECERLAPRLSALADGEAPASDLDVVRRHLRGCLACRANLREQYLAPAAVGALTPAPLFERWLIRPVERAAELLDALKVKAASLARLPGVDPASSGGQVAVSGGCRGLASAGLAKGLALLCIGGAGVGGAAACVEQLLDAARPDSARAADEALGEGDRRALRAPSSPDPRLVAERLRGSSGTPTSRRPSTSGRGGFARANRRRESSEPGPFRGVERASATGSGPSSDERLGPQRGVGERYRRQPPERSAPGGPTQRSPNDAGYDGGVNDEGYDGGVSDAGYDGGVSRPGDAGYDGGVSDPGCDRGLRRPRDAGYDSGLQPSHDAEHSGACRAPA